MEEVYFIEVDEMDSMTPCAMCGEEFESQDLDDDGVCEFCYETILDGCLESALDALLAGIDKKREMN